MTRASLLLLATSAACIIPDDEIRLEGDLDNPGAVRIVEAIALPSEMTAQCYDKDDPDISHCPQVPAVTIRSGFISPPAEEPFCVCPDGDSRRLPEFSIFAEDPDRAAERPVDRLYAVALLDFVPDEGDPPYESVAYTDEFPPAAPPELIEDRSAFNAQPSIGREDNLLWRFRFGASGGDGTDLCNSAGNGVVLSPGLHELKIMVTDRPFFRPDRLDENGEPLLDANGEPIPGAPQYGVPDLAIGATYAVSNWVFECHDPATNESCACDGDG